NLRHGRGARPSQVGVIDIGQYLVVRVGMDRGHDAVDHADPVVQHLDHRNQAVRGTGGIGNNGEIALQHLVFDAVDYRGIHVLTARRRNDDALRAALQVGAGLRLAGEQARAFEHVLHAEVAPRKFRRIALGEHPDPVAIDDHRVTVDLDLAGKTAVYGVVPRQMRVGFCVAEIVEGDDLHLTGALALIERAHDVAADAAVAIDPDLDWHDL